ncbi:MAG: hypothetical protein AAGH79_11000, partial [Bacteroidota bacterium]
MNLNLTLRISLFFLVAAAGIGLALYQPAGQALASDQESQVSQKLDRKTRIREAEQEELIRTMDPALGYIPRERLIEALEYTRQRQAEMVTNRGSITDAAWREQGPNNIGGRTRTIHVDLNDPTGETVWAGAVSGGLWKTTQFSAPDPKWEKFDDFFDNLAIGALAQDPNNPDIMYMGTGEIYTFSGATGNGIYKSTDNGQSWNKIPSTNNNNFDYTQKILVHPETGHIYVATVDGLWRSTTNGDSFFEVLGNTWGQSDFIYDIQLSPNGMIYASNANHLFRSSTGNGGEWENLTAGFISGYSRVEFTYCHSNPDRMYVIGVKDGEGKELYVSDNAGDSWAQRTQPGGYDFTQGQGYYDLVVGADPEACDNVIVGGAAIFQSIDAGQEWFGYYWSPLHPDHHVIQFDPNTPGRVLFGNDGGLYQSTLSSINNEVTNQNLGYNTTQFYAAAFHPDFTSDYMLGGTQDNNSLQLNGLGIAPARVVRGGDGMFCHIDQSDPQLQVVCSQFANYSLTRDGGTTWNDAAGFNGRFVSASDYDNVNHLMYSQTNDNDADYYRWDVEAGDFGTKVNVDEFDGNSINAITCDPNDPSTVYFGLSDGSVYRVLDANTGTTADAELLTDFVGSVSCVEVQIGNPDHIVVT